MKKSIRYRRIVVFSVLCLGILLLLGFTGNTVTAQAIQIDGEFVGNMVGYGEDQADQPHVIEIEGEVTPSGEDAAALRITVESSSDTVLDQGSVETFVEGDRDISFDRLDRSQSVVLTADNVPSGTTVQVGFETIYVGGTDADEINAGEVTVNYETAGGTTNQVTFEAPTDMSDSPDNRINTLQSEVDRLGQWRLIGIGGGTVGFVMLVAVVMLYRRCCKDKDEKPGDKPPGSEPPN